MQTAGLLCGVAVFAGRAGLCRHHRRRRTITGKMIVDASGESTTRIKGNKMRIDTARGNDVHVR